MSADESEESIDNGLRELGMLEDGMSLDDKRNIWNVIKLSKDTAQQEEQYRRESAGHSLQSDEVSSHTEISKETEREQETSPGVGAHDIRSPNSRSAAISNSPSSSEPSSTRDPSGSCSPNLKVTGPFPRKSLRSFLTQEKKEIDTVPKVSMSDVRNSQSVRNARSPSQSGLVKSVRSSLSSQSGLNIPSPDHASQHEQKAFSPEQVESVHSPHSVHSEHSPMQIQEDTLEICSQNTEPPRETLSPIHQVGYSKESIEERGPVQRRYSDVAKRNTRLSPVKQEEMQIGSPKSSDHESSPVRKIRQDLNFTLKFPQIEENDDNSCALSEEKNNVPSPVSAASINENDGIKTGNKEERDKDRNIDAFNCDRSNYDLTLKVCKPKRMPERLPFYIPPCIMEVHKYIAYFKKCIKEHETKLLKVQKKSHKCMPWGPPVVVDESLPAVAQETNLRSKRYNLRERRETTEKVNTIHDDDDDDDNDSQMQEKEQDEPDVLFEALLKEDKQSGSTNKVSATNSKQRFNLRNPRRNPKSIVETVYENMDEQDEDLFAAYHEDNKAGAVKKEEQTDSSRQCTKRKSDSGDEMEEGHASGNWLTAGKQKDEEIASKRKKLVAERNTGSAIIGKDEDLKAQPSKASKRRRRRRKLWMEKNNLLDVEDDTDMFAELDQVEITGQPSSSRKEPDIIKPAPVKLKRQGRKRVQQTRQEQNEDDVSVIFDSANTKSKEELLPCPICRVGFPVQDIEAHASECDAYREEEIIDTEDRNPSPQASSPQSWSEYEGVHENSSQGNLNSVVEAPMSPIRCFIPISEQQNSEIDYHNQFRVAATFRRPVARKKSNVRRKRNSTRKRKHTNKKRPTNKRKRSTSKGAARKKIKTESDIKKYIYVKKEKN